MGSVANRLAGILLALAVLAGGAVQASETGEATGGRPFALPRMPTDLDALRTDVKDHFSLEWEDAETVRFTGRIVGRAPDAILEALSRGARTLIITSDWGDGQYTVEIGRRVRASFVKVVVRDHCLGACALHILAAARTHEIEEGALVAFPTLPLAALADVLDHQIDTNGDIALRPLRAAVPSWGKAEADLFAERGLPIDLLFESVLAGRPDCIVTRQVPERLLVDVNRRAPLWTGSRSTVEATGLRIKGYWPETREGLAEAHKRVSAITREPIIPWEGSGLSGAPLRAKVRDLTLCTQVQFANIMAGRPAGAPEERWQRPTPLRGRVDGVRIVGDRLEVTKDLFAPAIDRIGQLDLSGVTKLSVRLLRMDPQSAVRLAEMVRENGWSVEVDGYCIGPCVSILLPAATRITLAGESLIGLSISATVMEWLAEADDDRMALFHLSHLAQVERAYLERYGLPRELLVGMIPALEPKCRTSVMSRERGMTIPGLKSDYHTLVLSPAQLRSMGIEIEGYTVSVVTFRRILARIAADMPGMGHRYRHPLVDPAEAERIVRALPLCTETDLEAVRELFGN